MKKNIYTIIIVLALGGALVMGYMAFTKKSATDVPSQQNVADKTPDYSVLPQGRQLNFDKLSEYNKNNTLFPYPKVQPQEIGSNLGSLLQ